jgi:hypothetical protein
MEQTASMVSVVRACDLLPPLRSIHFLSNETAGAGHTKQIDIKNLKYIKGRNPTVSSHFFFLSIFYS